MLRLRKSIVILTILFLSVTNLYAGEILVSAAISMKSAFTEIVKEFEREHPGEKVMVNYASSGKLMKQIELGARVDVFASASHHEIDSLVSKGFINSRSVRIFAENRLAIISDKCGNRPLFLLDDDVKNIAIGNPATVPAGKYAKEFLANIKIYNRLEKKLVFAENARQIVDYVVRKDVDAGIVYKTDAAIAADKVTHCMDLDDEMHEHIGYSIAAVSGSKNGVLTDAFIDFVTSKTGESVLTDYGFTIPKEKQ